MNRHPELRKAAIEAITNYMHNSLFDAIPINMVEFVRMQADVLMQHVDRAIDNTIEDGKRKGLIMK